MQSKPTCMGLWQRLMADCYTEQEYRDRAYGWKCGLAEAIVLGSRDAAMFRVTEERDREWTRRQLDTICDIVQEYYGVKLLWDFFAELAEFWLYRNDEGMGVRIWLIPQLLQQVMACPCEVCWQDYHRHRGVLCGIPLVEIDGRYHEREAD